jgi:hypothetical protein
MTSRERHSMQRLDLISAGSSIHQAVTGSLELRPDSQRGEDPKVGALQSSKHVKFMKNP